MVVTDKEVKQYLLDRITELDNIEKDGTVFVFIGMLPVIETILEIEQELFPMDEDSWGTYKSRVLKTVVEEDLLEKLREISTTFITRRQAVKLTHSDVALPVQSPNKVATLANPYVFSSGAVLHHLREAIEKLFTLIETGTESEVALRKAKLLIMVNDKAHLFGVPR